MRLVEEAVEVRLASVLIAADEPVLLALQNTVLDDAPSGHSRYRAGS